MKKNYGKALRKEKKGFLEAKLLFFSLEVIFPQGKNPQAGKRTKGLENIARKAVASKAPVYMYMYKKF